MKTINNNQSVIVLGGGCFWCTEAVFLNIPGIIKVMPGYAGGWKIDPSYEEVVVGETGHAEVVQLKYDFSIIKLSQILSIFFKMHNPTSVNRQGADVGTQYRSIILYNTDKQKKLITDFISQIQESYSQPIVTEIKKIDHFYPAEQYHQRYFAKHPENAYCTNVIAPKLEKIKQDFNYGQIES